MFANVFSRELMLLHPPMPGFWGNFAFMGRGEQEMSGWEAMAMDSRCGQKREIRTGNLLFRLIRPLP
ncbi:hypothetical protein CLOM_g15885 [Closterium sp. NIES-68]|nr:hypothetical protein CLOM_g15885 [Closterium sp. NIES-68]GJP69631.1 hypothetical protein CLOP_g621 [Closterium sp. NIES-67]